jgi:DNA polymerase (family X)
MQQKQIVKILEEMGDLLELSEDNPYKARAYYRGAEALRENPDCNLEDSHSLLELPGIGESLARLILELKSKGTSEHLVELRGQVPAEFRRLLHFPGLGAKTIRAILKEIKPRNLGELERAIKDREIRKIKGLSSKTEAKLKRGLELMRNPQADFPLGQVLPLGRELEEFLTKVSGVTAAGLVGSTLRGKETVRDLDIVVGTADSSKVLAALSTHAKLEKVLQKEEGHLSFVTWLGLPGDVYLVPPEAYIAAHQQLQGAVEHHRHLIELGKEKGFQWEFVPPNVYSQLGLPEFPPELREGDLLVEISPELIQLPDIKGDLHMHTRWSDGGNSIKEMAVAAADKGYEYIAICDHSQNLAIAKGLKGEQLRQQRLEIDKVNLQLDGKFKVLAGTETDILKNGELDYADELLAELDIVVASVHQRFKLDIDQMTERIVTALKNPHVDILAHPTGRLVGSRDPYDIHLEKIFEAAAKNKKALEINASPSRLDLKDKYASMARDYGIPIVIDTDAHSIDELNDMEYGVITARRANLDKSQVLNTKTLPELEEWLRR